MGEQIATGITRRLLLFLVLLVLLFVPSNVYISLAGGALGIIGTYTIVLLFTYVSRYLGADLTKQEVYALFYALSYSWIFFNSYDVIYRAYLRVSEVTREFKIGGAPIASLLPTWLSPPAGSPVFELRTLIHPDMALPLLIPLMLSISWIVAELSLITLISFLFVEVEALPYPLAPINAAFITTISERPAEWLRSFLPAAGITLVFSTLLYLPAVGFIVGLPVPTLGLIDFSQQVVEVLPGAAVGINLIPAIILPGIMIPLDVAAAALATSIAVWILFNSLVIVHPLFRSWFPDWAKEYYKGMSYYLIIERSTLRVWAPVQVGALLALSAVLIARYHRGIVRAFSILSKASSASARGYPPLRFLLGAFLVSSGLSTALYWTLLPGLPLPTVAGLIVGVGLFLSLSNAYMVGKTGGSLFQVPPYLWQTAVYSLPPGSVPLSTEVTALLFPPPTIGMLTGGGTQAVKVAYLVGARPTDLIKAIAIAYVLGTIANIFVVDAMWRVAPIPSMIFPNTVWMRDRAVNDCLVAARQLPLKPTVVFPAFMFFLLLFSSIESLNRFLGLPLSTAGVAMGLTRPPADMMPIFIASLVGNVVIPRLLGRSELARKWGELKSVMISGALLGDGIAASVFTLATLIGRTSWTWPW